MIEARQRSVGSANVYETSRGGRTVAAGIHPEHDGFRLDVTPGSI